MSAGSKSGIAAGATASSKTDKIALSWLAKLRARKVTNSASHNSLQQLWVEHSEYMGGGVLSDCPFGLLCEKQRTLECLISRHLVAD